MDIYDKVACNILYYMNKLEKNEEFIRECPGITAFEYLCVKTKITPKRLSTILKVGANRRTTLNEVYRICVVLGVGMGDIISNEVKYIDK